MKNVNNILSDGTATQRALIYFENLCTESIKEGTGIAGFLSNLEETKLYNTFNSESERKIFNRFNKAYHRITTALDKLLIQRLMFEVSAEGYFWVDICHKNQNTLLESINETLFKEKENIENNTVQPKEPITKLFFGQLYRDDIFFEIETNKNMPIPENLPLIKFATTDKLIKVKSSIHAINTYMNEAGFKVKQYEDLIKKVESETINLCLNIKIDYPQVQIDEQYSNWFKSYFLDNLDD